MTKFTQEIVHPSETANIIQKYFDDGWSLAKSEMYAEPENGKLVSKMLVLFMKNGVEKEEVQE